MSSRPSDCEVQAYVRGTTTTKVSFNLDSVESTTISARCSCSSAAKGQLCKHIWAGLLKVEQTHSDFLEEKKDIEIGSSWQQAPAANSSMKTFPEETFKPLKKPVSADQLARNAALKEKQSDYRKLQYQKQKLRLQQKKLAEKKTAKDIPPEPSFEIARALDFFTKNGFPLTLPCDVFTLNLAKKKLSRVFHPDTGGTHDEIVELNKNFETLINFSKKLN